jgi:hypothetical protein
LVSGGQDDQLHIYDIKVGDEPLRARGGGRGMKQFGGYGAPYARCQYMLIHG